MEFNSFLQSLGEDDVLSFSDVNVCKAGVLKKTVNSVLNSSEITDLAVARLENSGIKGLSFYDKEKHVSKNNLWMTEGKTCEVLKVGAQDWIKGRLKIRVIVEFEPEIPEPQASTLDDIRQMISE